MTDILDRIEREAGVPGLADILADRLAPTDLQSLLLEVYRRRARRTTPSQILAAYRGSRFVQPSAVSPISLLQWEQIAFSNLPPGFEPIALAPVCPLGTCSAIAGVDQNRSLTTIRNSEVVSDSTNVLALECAIRRRALLRSDPRSAETVHLAASHRLLRAQRYSDPRNLAHFSLFALCSAGRDQGDLRFEVSSLLAHARFYLQTLRTFLGQRYPLRLLLADFGTPARQGLIEESILAPLRSEFEEVECCYDDARTSGRGYYPGVCFAIDVLSDGLWLNLADGGCVDWTQRLLSNAKERLVTSGIGSERVCNLRPPGSSR